MLEVLGQDYVRTARAKGLAGWGVVVRHALKNALIPIITIFGLQFGNLLAGAVIVETVFSRPGLGRLIVGGILNKDFPLVQGTVLFVATAYVLINVLVDIAYALSSTRASGSADVRRRPGAPARAPPRRDGRPGDPRRCWPCWPLAAPWLSPRDPIRTAPRDARCSRPGATYSSAATSSAATWPSRVLHGARISLDGGADRGRRSPWASARRSASCPASTADGSTPS